MRIWQDIQKFPGYQASNMGEIRAPSGKILKPYANSGGYLRVAVYVDEWRCRSKKHTCKEVGCTWEQLHVEHVCEGATCPAGHRTRKRRQPFVHRLVMMAFGWPPPSPDHEVSHENGIQTDNRLENLEWRTPVENYHQKPAHKRPGRVVRKLSPGQVGAIRRSTMSGVKLARRYGVSQATIRDIRNGRRRRPRRK